MVVLRIHISNVKKFMNWIVYIYHMCFLAVQNSSIGDLLSLGSLVPGLGTTNNQSLHNTTE